MVTLETQVELSQQTTISEAELVETLLQQNYSTEKTQEDCDSCGVSCGDQ